MPEPGYLAVFLELVRVHLPSLTSVTLVFYVRDLDWYHNKCLWDVLARFSHLQKLQLHFGNPEFEKQAPTMVYMWPGNVDYHRNRYYADLPLNKLRALSSLNTLSSLTVTAPNISNPQSYAFVSCLTALTHLQLPLVLCQHYDWVGYDFDEDEGVPPEGSRMAPFTALAQLQSLALAATSSNILLAGSDCSSLAQLTSLTKLQLKAVCGLGSEGLLQQLLTPLQQLQVLQLPKMKPSVALPVLACLVNLRELSIDWEEEAQGRSGRRAMSRLACPSIRSLTCEGPVPVEALPEVSQGLQIIRI